MKDLPPDALEQVAAYFQALSEPTRLRILNLLRSGEHNVGELAQECGYTAANVSRHLSLLTKMAWWHARVGAIARTTALLTRRCTSCVIWSAAVWRASSIAKPSSVLRSVCLAQQLRPSASLRRRTSRPHQVARTQFPGAAPCFF